MLLFNVYFLTSQLITMMWPFVGIDPSIIHTIITFNHWCILLHSYRYIRLHQG